MKISKFLLVAVLGLGLMASCARERSATTGWEFNNPNNGGYQKFHSLTRKLQYGIGFSRRWYVHYGTV